MPIYQAPIKDYEYILYDLLKIDEHFEVAKDRDLILSIISEGARFAENIIFPLNQHGDAQGCKYIDGKVITPDGFKAAYQQYIEAGWMGMTFSSEYGGQDMPEILNMPITESICSSNLSFGLTPGLSHAAYNAINAHASKELKDKYLPKITSGQWSGVMCLTEPQAGTDLGLIKTKATPNADGSYNITGTKIFISSGEQDLTSNIIHLVLAKLPDAPLGSKGISLFLVDRSEGGVSCGGIEHKMGLMASPTCIMNYDSARGYIIGNPNEGLKCMFTMMNEARLYVGIQGLGIAEVAYQNALSYARDRMQGKAIKSTSDKVADPIIVHPDVKRMLLTIKSITEGMRMLAFYTAMNVDLAKHGDKEADDFVQLATPIVKSYLTDMGFEMASLAMQVLGGYGYIREYGVEQFARDARITMIYEGTNGIQAMDLVGRKLAVDYGKLPRSFFHPAAKLLEEHKTHEFAVYFTKSVESLQKATGYVAMAGVKNPSDALAVATDYQRLFALNMVAFMWFKAAIISADKEDQFNKDKVKTARFFMEKILSDHYSLLAKITSGGKVVMEGI